MKKKVVAALMSVAMVATLLAGCGSKAEDTTTATDTTATTEDTADKADEAAADTKEGGHKFGYTYWAASDFFSTIGDTLTEIAKENGDEVIVVDAQQDQSKQISIIEDFITQGVDAVFLNPVDREG